MEELSENPLLPEKRPLVEYSSSEDEMSQLAYDPQRVTIAPMVPKG